MSEECFSCKKQINKSDTKTSVSCPTCQLKFHSFCVNIVNKKWKCVKCSTETSSTPEDHKDEINAVLKAIEAFRKENQASWIENNQRWDNIDVKIAKLQKDIESTNKKIADIKDSVEKVENKCDAACQSVEEIRRENEQLKVDCKLVNQKLNNLQQQIRKNNLIVSGVPLTHREDMFVVIQAIASVLNVNFYYSEINAAHRLQSRKGDTRPPSIVISFTSRLTKNQWLAARRQRGSLSARDLNSSFPNTPVYVNEHLTPETREIFNAARQFVKERTLSSVWTSDCKVMAKSAADQHPFRVHDLDQLTSLREKRAAAATPPPTTRDDAAPTPTPTQVEANTTLP